MTFKFKIFAKIDVNLLNCTFSWILQNVCITIGLY